MPPPAAARITVAPMPSLSKVRLCIFVMPGHAPRLAISVASFQRTALEKAD
jgi:hypothetical protein